MELQTAVALLAITPATTPQVWADLGCGSGLFTQALARQLPYGSCIHAIDRTRTLSASVLSTQNVRIVEHLADFEQVVPVDDLLDGIVMANSLHFVKDQVGLLKNLKGHLKPSGKLQIVEYDTDRGSQWVPYPLSVETLKKICQTAGFKSITLTTHVNSVFGHARIYGACVV